MQGSPLESVSWRLVSRSRISICRFHQVLQNLEKDREALFSYQRKNTGSRSFPPRLSGKNTRSPANMATSVPMCPQALGRGCHALYPAGELCHRRLDMLTRSLLSAVFCLLPIILQPLPVAAESILLDGRMTTTTRPWLDKRARQWLDAREPLTIGVVSPDYPPLSIFYAGSYKGFTADYLALVFERPLRVRDFPSRQAAIAALSRGEIDLLGVGSEVEARQHGLLASAAYLSDRPVLVSSSGAPFDSQAESWLATVKGYLPAERIKAAYPHSKVIWFDSPQLALEALSMGDVDGVLGDAVSAHYLIQTHYLLNLRIENFAPIDSQGFRFLLRPGQECGAGNGAHAGDLQRHLPRLGADPAGAEADRRAHRRGRLARTGGTRPAGGKATLAGLRHPRATRRTDAVPLQRSRRPGARRGLEHGWRLGGAVAGAASLSPDPLPEGRGNHPEFARPIA